MTADITLNYDIMTNMSFDDAIYILDALGFKVNINLIYNEKDIKEISIDYIQKVVCDYFKIPVDSIQSETRKREIVQARQVAMFFAKGLTKSSLATIGAQIGGKDHATVLHACKTVNNLCDTELIYMNQIKDIEKILIGKQ